MTDGAQFHTAERITAKGAGLYFSDPSQQLYGITPETVPDDEPYQYWACGPVCGLFHIGPMPGVWMGHFAVIPEYRGHLTIPARVVLRDFSIGNGYPLIMGWTPSSRRAAIAFVKRLGFKQLGEFFANGEEFTISTWSQSWG